MRHWNKIGKGKEEEITINLTPVTNTMERKQNESQKNWLEKQNANQKLK